MVNLEKIFGPARKEIYVCIPVHKKLVHLKADFEFKSMNDLLDDMCNYYKEKKNNGS